MPFDRSRLGTAGGNTESASAEQYRRSDDGDSIETTMTARICATGTAGVPNSLMVADHWILSWACQPEDQRYRRIEPSVRHQHGARATQRMLGAGLQFEVNTKEKSNVMRASFSLSSEQRHERCIAERRALARRARRRA